MSLRNKVVLTTLPLRESVKKEEERERRERISLSLNMRVPRRVCPPFLSSVHPLYYSILHPQHARASSGCCPRQSMSSRQYAPLREWHCQASIQGKSCVSRFLCQEGHYVGQSVHKSVYTVAKLSNASHSHNSK